MPLHYSEYNNNFVLLGLFMGFLVSDKIEIYTVEFYIL